MVSKASVTAGWHLTGESRRRMKSGCVKTRMAAARSAPERVARRSAPSTPRDAEPRELEVG
jgi:hypothetical protein